MRKLWILLACAAFAAAIYFGWYFSHDQRDEPGKVANPKLAELLNLEITTWGERTQGAGMSPTAQQGANEWFSEIREVSISFVRTQPSKFSYSEAEFVLNNGRRFSHRCGERGVLPVRLEFANGKSTAAWTDGRERSADVAQAKASLARVVDCIIFADADLSTPNSHPDRYYKRAPVGKTPAEISNEWKE